MFAREKKAAKLADACFRIGATAEDVLSADAEDWKRIAELATEWSEEPTNPPNPKNPKPTVDAVVAALVRMQKEVMPETEVCTQPEGGFGSPFENYTPAQQESDEAAAAERKAEDKWEESQEYAGNRCPPRE